jgi:hypothetical protein
MMKLTLNLQNKNIFSASYNLFILLCNFYKFEYYIQTLPLDSYMHNCFEK